MPIVVYEQDQSVGMVAKQLRGLTINKHDKWAFAKMAIVAGLFLICCGIYLRCSISYSFPHRINNETTPIPMLVLNDAINPAAYAFYKGT